MEADPLETDAERAILNANRLLARVASPDLTMRKWWALHMAQADLREALEAYRTARTCLPGMTEKLTRRTSRLT